MLIRWLKLLILNILVSQLLLKMNQIIVSNYLKEQILILTQTNNGI